MAIDLPRAVRQEMRRRLDPLPERLPRARWIDPSRAHLTLVFLGEREPESVDPLAEAIEEEASETAPFEIRLVDGGTFPPGRPARVAWIGVEAPESLFDLQRRIDARTAAVLERSTDDRAYHPHITVARPKARWGREATESFVASTRGTWGEPFEVDEVVLFSSELRSDGAVYTAEHRISLGPGSKPE